MKPSSIGSTYFSHSSTSGTGAAGSSTQQPSSGSSSHGEANPALQGLPGASRRRARQGLRFEHWVGVEGQPHSPAILDTRTRREKYIQDVKPDDVSPEDVRPSDYKYRASSENREMMLQEYAHKTAEHLYDAYHGAPLPKESKNLLEKGDPHYTKIRGDKKERQKEGKMALKQYEYLARDAKDPKVNYDHQRLYAPREVRRLRLRELEAAAMAKESSASDSDS